MGNLIGYARVSTVDQNLDSQLDALRKAGAAQIFTDKLSGSTTVRPQLQACLAYLNPGDVLAVYSTDRLGRSVGDLIEIVGRLRDQGIQFKSLTEPFDTTDHGGELFFHIVAAFAQMQRRQISEKTRAGLAAAKARGRLGGRPTVMTPDRIAHARQMRAEGKSFDDIAALLGVGASSVKRALRDQAAADVRGSVLLDFYEDCRAVELSTGQGRFIGFGGWGAGGGFWRFAFGGLR